MKSFISFLALASTTIAISIKAGDKKADQEAAIASALAEQVKEPATRGDEDKNCSDLEAMYFGQWAPGDSYQFADYYILWDNWDTAWKFATSEHTENNWDWDADKNSFKLVWSDVEDVYDAYVAACFP